MISNNKIPNLVEHHVKYEELHGVDETVWMENGEHQKLHHRLRKENKCNVPVEVLAEISRKAHQRTKKAKDRHTKSTRKYNQSTHGKMVRTNYDKLKDRIAFTETMDLNIGFHETITYNNATGTVTCCAWFCGKHGRKLLIIDI